MILIQPQVKGKDVIITDENGHGVVCFEVRAETSIAIIFNLYVDEKFRRRGTAASLLQKAESEARKLGCKIIEISRFSLERESWMLPWIEGLGYRNTSFEHIADMMCKYL